MSPKLARYVDDYQNIHIQGEVLGKGGQGVVFRTKDPDVAIKLVTDENGTAVTDRELVHWYSKLFKRVRLLPLPENLNISVPAALLQDSAGYVMQLLSEMVPFSHFWIDSISAEHIASDDVPTWLSSMPVSEAKKIVHYYKTGGLRRRLIALYKCSTLLARLHSKGMVYGDISPNNIFISEGLEDSSVWLIDADNIRFEISASGRAFYTPKYGAPELVVGKEGGRPASDCHAFAVVSFYLLSLIHPFIGRMVDGTEEHDWADDENDNEDIEEKAYAGFFPWVDDPSDDSNSSEAGLPRPLLLTEKLKTLFEATFGPGRTSPALRPTIYHWPEALAQAADTTITCPGCSMSYYYDFVHSEIDSHSCPYCKTQRPQVLILESYQWDGANSPLNLSCWRFVREINNNSELIVPRRVFDDFTMVDSDTAEASISISGKYVLIKKAGHSKIDLSVSVDGQPQNAFQEIYSQLKIVRTSSELRFWLFANLKAPRLVLCTISGGWQ